MSFKEILQGGWNSLKDLFYPSCCTLCGEVLQPEERYVCQECLRELPRTETGDHRGNRVEALFEDIEKVVRGATFCYFSHDSDFRRLIHAVKYRGKAGLGEYLGEQAGREMLDSRFFEGIDLIVPVPLHKKRERRRGYNQAEYICIGLGRATGIAVDTQHLRRKRATPSQTTLSSDEREQNMEDAFEVVNGKDWQGKHILLVDDIITTGATMRACIHKMTPIRGCHISVFALGLAGNSREERGIRGEGVK